MKGTPWVAAVAVLALLLGLVMVLGGRGMGRRQGLGVGKTVALDNMTLGSRRYGLTGRPDRLLREGGTIIPEEWKTAARQLRPWHRAQMGVYFVLIEQELGVRPPHEPRHRGGKQDSLMLRAGPNGPSRGDA